MLRAARPEIYRCNKILKSEYYDDYDDDYYYDDDDDDVRPLYF